MSPEFTEDGFLGGRLVIAQPRAGFRAGHDAVLLAAAVAAKPGEHALELGSGTGVASLCLAARVANLRVEGIEIHAELVKLANENAARNQMAERISFTRGDVEQIELGGRLFDHVFLNPPFHPDTGQISPHPARDLAKRDSSRTVASWTKVALAAAKPEGIVTAIVRADREHEIVDIVEGRGVTIIPLYPRNREAPKRIIVYIEKASDRSIRVTHGLVLHLANGKPTAGAEAVLRYGAPLPILDPGS